MELCYDTLRGILKWKLNEFKRILIEVMTTLEYNISAKKVFQIKFENYSEFSLKFIVSLKLQYIQENCL